MEPTTPTPMGPRPTIDREQTAPFLIRTFVKIGGFHRLALFEDGVLPTTDEQQIFTWKDATLRELLTTLRIAAPRTAEYRHPLARYSFRALYADPTNRGHFAQKDLGIVYSRDILGEPGTINAPANRLQEDFDGEKMEISEREKQERTLEELKLMSGDYLCVAVLLPKNVTLGTDTTAPNPKVTAAAGWRNQGRATDGGWGSGAAPSGPAGRGGGHWRGGSDAPGPTARGRGTRADTLRRDIDRDRDRDLPGRDRRVPPPRRARDSTPPPRGSWGRERDRRSRSRSPVGRSRSRSPPPRRNSRYD